MESNCAADPAAVRMGLNKRRAETSLRSEALSQPLTDKIEMMIVATTCFWFKE